ncbi:heme-molybdoenzyme heme-containing subunit YedZ; cytochrome b subunit [Georgfuchsia toluolica]|uniref:Protein-methionine-sulfoxide reductase heme-binding subunit MsrQ n=1 Tax=Georgfuchsia toluolica TaxID=424218 RepID=A0A916J6F6_9PROT|nr:protein-methionine-sulfoxide reductase heme-binding subunit MsrQ [Georgfuchsia toluolica]CAG4884040.1 heme-molybdoenzyme heme-containing subunit YedZ; cytochrome b subunit [Georgfuchsia toluolica]
MKLSSKQIAALKVIVFILCLVPLAYLGWGLWQDMLGANPIENLIRSLGRWTLKFLLITLSITPLRRLTGMNALLRFRRMLGLFCFFYAVLHWSVYLGLDQSFNWVAIAKDIVKRPFITMGMLTFTMLLPLAITSTNGMMRRMGARNWQALHRAVYVIGICAVLHFWWMVKLDTTWPKIYALILTLLLGMRLAWRLRLAKG